MSSHLNDNTRTPVIDVSHSRGARLQPLPVSAVELRGDFWAARLRRNVDTSLPTQYALLESTGRLNNFRRVVGKHDGPFAGIFFNDSDVYKWLEAASWALASGRDAALEAMMDEAIALVQGAQQADGYLNTWFSLERAHLRWTDLRDQHEMYCAGHLMQAAVAHHRMTGDTRLLNVACRFADLLLQVFGPPDEGKRLAIDGHEEIEMALIELARETGHARYLGLARFFIESRGQGLLHGGRWGLEYFQDHLPIRQLKTLGGHAVRAMYMACGVTDLYLETGEEGLLAQLEELWTHMTTRRMYISGGLGSRHDGESFGADFELPNARAYTETCAAIGSIMWSQRLLLATGRARYADLLEWTLFNGMLPGWSLSGQRYFYVNPLEDDGGHQRRAWYEVACCPPNVARMLASLPGYVYATQGDHEVWVNLYVEGEARLQLGAQALRLVQRTRYPWDGAVEIEIDGDAEFTLRLRIPGWCNEGATVAVNGEPVADAPVAGHYLAIARRWRRGDRVQLSLPMPVRVWESNPRVAENTQRVALSRGPLLYCVEGVDHAGVDLAALAVDPQAGLLPGFEAEKLDGVVVLRGPGQCLASGETWPDGPLYRPVLHETAAPPQPAAITAIPYFSWQNRGPSPMRVWLRRTDDAVR
ncbi:MAG: beta-L-arabinofuranosidase domain-containing protein [Rhizobacter sp.]